MAMSSQTSYSRSTGGFRTGARPVHDEPRGPVIDQEGREIPADELGDGFRFEFDFANSAFRLFGNLTREQRLARLDAVAKLLDVVFVLPGTKVRYGVDGIIGLIPIVGDLISTALSLWLVREAYALGAPWHVIARMLGNVAVQGVVGAVPLAGDALDVLFRANMRNVRIVRRWMAKSDKDAFANPGSRHEGAPRRPDGLHENRMRSR